MDLALVAIVALSSGGCGSPSATISAPLGALDHNHAASGKFATLYSFNACCGYENGQQPDTTVVRDSEGNLYGTATGASQVYAVAYKIHDKAETVLHSFSPTYGYGLTALTFDSKGNLYGAAGLGGAKGFGDVFELPKGGGFKIIHSFAGPDGHGPGGPIVVEPDGTLYGTTSGGGKGNSGYGVFYKISPSGSESVLHSFGKGKDGRVPIGQIVQDSHGVFYGVTNQPVAGTVYKITTTGKETQLARFSGSHAPFSPEAGPTLDKLGNLYGTTSAGGDGYGVVYKVTPNGRVTVLHAFQSGADGSAPWSELTFDADGNLFGTTAAGGQVGSGYSSGTLFEITASGKERIVFRFATNFDYGGEPRAGLIYALHNRTFYGTAQDGGTQQSGSVFAFKP